MQGINYGKVLFSRFVYSAWEGYKCSVPISREEKRRILDKLYLCGLGKGEFPDEIMNYPTKFSKFIEDLTEKSVREYIYSQHSSIVLKFIEIYIKKQCFFVVLVLAFLTTNSTPTIYFNELLEVLCDTTTLEQVL